MFIPLICSIKIALSSRFSMYYFIKLLCLLLYFFCANLIQPLTTWSIDFHMHSLYSVSFWLLSIFALTKFDLILWFCDATIRLSVSFFKSPFWSQIQLGSLMTYLVYLKYWSCGVFSSQSFILFSFCSFFKVLFSSKPSTLSPPVAYCSLFPLSWSYTSHPLITNSTQYSIAIKHLPLSFLGICNLPTPYFWCNLPYIVSNFLVFLSTACNPHFLQLVNAAKYLKRDTAQVLTLWTKLPPFSFDFKTFFNLLKYPLETFSFINSPKNLSASKVLRYL